MGQGAGPGRSGGAAASSAPRQGTVKVADGRGGIEERKVELGVSNRVQAQVLSGLAEGEQVVSGLVVGAGSGRPQMTPRL
jgi:macrolide-specific efflux system membrane fusion protein